jgi:tRNA (cytidine/uridine-2'-O-)-methyltransferase
MTLSSGGSRRIPLRPRDPGVSRREDLHVVLLAPEIHWNTGNAGRSCLAAGARLHLIEPLGFSLDERELRRAGLDYWPRVPLEVWPSWEALARTFDPAWDPWFFSSEGVRDYWAVGYRRPAFLVFGRESVGLPPALRETHADRLLRIPMADPELRSINLSTAIGIALYEVRRQWSGVSPSPSRS